MTVQHGSIINSLQYKHLALLLFLGALALNLAGNGRISLWDRDEPRFSQASRQMLDSGDYVVPHFNDGPRYDKPVLIYWLMGAAMKVFGVNEFSARLPAAAAGAGTVLIIFLLALRMGCGKESAALAALVTMTAMLTLGVAKAATTDGVLTLSVAAMMALLWRQRQGAFSWGAHLTLYGVLGASALLKGPPGVLIFVTAAAGEWIWRRRLGQGKLESGTLESGRLGSGTLERGSEDDYDYDYEHEHEHERGQRQGQEGTVWRTQAVRWGAAAVVFCLVTVPWVVMVQQRTGGDFLRVAWGHHVVDRATQPLENHGGKGLNYFFCLPLYIPVLVVGLFPWTAPALLGLRGAWRRRNEPARRFLWCWLAPSFVVFSLAATKLPHYMAPLAPALALMTGLWWEEVRNGRGGTAEEAGTGWRTSGAVLTGLFGVLLGGGILGIAIYIRYGALLAPAILAAVAAAGGSLWGAWLWRRRQAGGALAAWGAMMAALCLILFLWALPAIEPLKPSKGVVAWVRQNTPAGTRLLAAEYKEPTLVFYWGRTVEMLGDKHPEDALPLLSDKTRPTALIITKRLWETWIKDLPELARVTGEIRYRQPYFAFQRGTRGEMVVVGNW